MYKKISLAVISAVAFSNQANAESTLLFTGASFTEDSYYAHLGGVHALNGNIKTDGFVLRATGAYGQYDYTRTGNTDVDGDVSAIDLMAGYQLYNGGHRFTFYLGADYQDHDLSPDDTLNPVRGDDFGLKGQAEASLVLDKNANIDLIGSYSGAFDTYWSKAQLGYSVDALFDTGCDTKIGPELAFMGSESYDQQRYGVFFKDRDLGEANLGGSAGYAKTEGLGEDGAYAEVTLSFGF